MRINSEKFEQILFDKYGIVWKDAVDERYSTYQKDGWDHLPLRKDMWYVEEVLIGIIIQELFTKTNTCFVNNEGIKPLNGWVVGQYQIEWEMECGKEWTKVQGDTIYEALKKAVESLY